jgi:hypothetical protein
MVSKKQFTNVELNILQNLVGKRLNNIFKQLDFFIINFGDEIEYSLHTYCFLRIRTTDTIILTSADEYYFPDYNFMSEEQYEQDEMHQKSLLCNTIYRTKELLRDAIISKVEISNTADIIIQFDNGIVIETFTNFQQHNAEFFRFFERDNLDEPHYVIKFENSCIVLEKVFTDSEIIASLDTIG